MNKLLNLTMVLAVSLSLIGGCSPTGIAPTPEGDETSGSEPEQKLFDVVDAVLLYVGETHGLQIPAMDTGWDAKQTKPENVVGDEWYEFAAGDWVLTVSYPAVAPEAEIFTIVLSNRARGFHWEGQIDVKGKITETSSTEVGEIIVSSREAALEAALAYLEQAIPGKAPPAGLSWMETRVTPEGLLNSETYEYVAGDWLLTMSYPVTSPQQTIYAVALGNRATGFRWELSVDAMEEVIELGVPSEADLAQLVRDNSAFAFALYQVLGEDATRNLFFSPYSISAAVAMTYAGAHGETEKQMAQALHYGLPPAQLHPAFHALAQELSRQGEGAAGKDESSFRLNIVNALWGQEGYNFLPDFIGLLAQYYGAGLRRLDFTQMNQSRAAINDWVSEQTEDRIRDLIPSGVLDELTRLVLTNGIYFTATWAMPFDKTVTRNEPFTRLDGSQAVVPMMSQTGSFAYADGDDYQAVELLYDGHEMSMVILLPAQGEFEVFDASLDGAKVEAILDRLAPQPVALTMPRWEFESAFSLREALSALGMPVAFSANADFSGMDGSQDLFISAVLHKAHISVDEAGTEAAAAAAVVVNLKSVMPTEPVGFRADRPFLFLVRDHQTGALLFIGRVLDPSA